jgi:hypothetical protein
MSHCPHCRARVIQRGQDGRLKVRTAIIAITEKSVIAACKRCGGDVSLDLQPGESLVKALTQPRLVIRKLDGGESAQ